MRRHLLVVSIAVVFLGAACASSRPSTPATTSVGTPTGSAVSSHVGASGGQLASADGLLMVTVPAGALSADTELTVTPLSVEAPGGLRAYRLGPEGTTFASPVTVTLHYSAADLAGSSSDALGIAYQDSDHHWRTLSAATVSTADQTVKVTTSHFSDWSLLRGWQIQPPKAVVQTKGTVALSVQFCDQVNVGTAKDELYTLASKCQSDADLALPLMHWSVNGTVGGSSSTGTVTQGNPSAVYTAPAKAPSGSVAVSVELGPQGIRAKQLLVSNITVQDDSPPASFDATLSLTSKAGGGTTGLLQEDYTGTVTLHLVLDTKQGSHYYKMDTGTVTLQASAIEAAGCICTGTGSTSMRGDPGLDASFTYTPASGGGGTMGMAYASTVPVSLSCTPKAADVTTCPSSGSITTNWHLGDDIVSPCTGSVSNTYVTMESMSGSYQKHCPAFDTTLQVSGTFTPHP